MFACIHWPEGEAALLDVAGAFSPWVEQVAADTVLFSIDGLQRVFGDAQAIAKAIAGRAPDAHVAIAATPDAAMLAARQLKGVGVIPPGHEMRYLGSLPLACLPVEADTLRILDRWGLGTLEQLASLPENGLQERLGAAGVQLQRLARGALGRPLKPIIAVTVYEESQEFDYGLEQLEPLLFLLARFLNDLCARLKRQSLAAGELHLSLNRVERVLRLPFPTRDTKFLLKILQHHLETQASGEPVTKVVLRIAPVEPRLIQHDLFSLPAPEPEKLELTLGKIRGLVGERNVKTPAIRDTYRPGWGAAESNLAFRHYRPPLEARLEMESGRPRRLRAPGIQGDIRQISGPWRKSGDWWREDAWDRDEFDLELNSGALCRIYFDRRLQRWFVEGTYD